MYELTRADIASRRSNGPDAMDGDGIELRSLESRTPTANPIHASARCEEAAGAPESKHDSPEPLSQVKVAVSEGPSFSAEEESSAAGVGRAKQLNTSGRMDYADASSKSDEVEDPELPVEIFGSAQRASEFTAENAMSAQLPTRKGEQKSI